MPRVRSIAALVLAATAACGGESGTTAPAGDVRVGTPLTAQAAVVGTAFSFDATAGGAAFVDPKRTTLTYRVDFVPAGVFTATNGRVSGTPAAPGVVQARVTAFSALGDSASQTFPIASFAAGLPALQLPATPHSYVVQLPAHFVVPAPGGSAIATDNTGGNPVTDAGATLGRVLFYDRRLSGNDGIACASCHVQQTGFADTARFSLGFRGGRTGRHSMALANARFYQSGRFFWDERAVSLEDQVLRPIQDTVEMGLTLAQLVAKLQATSYYPALFTGAFGTPEITSDRVARALAQFVRAMVSTRARYDSAFNASGQLIPGVLTAEEELGRQVFVGPGRCAPCHTTNAVVSDGVHNTGLDATITDAGAGNGRFKAPSLRNVGVRARFMHDGRFTTLEQVVQFYDQGVQANPGLDPRLRQPMTGGPIRLNLTAQQRSALVSFLRTLTDRSFLEDPRFSSPFTP